MILCFFGGFLLDRVFGVRVGTIIFSSFVVVGQLIYALGKVVLRICWGANCIMTSMGSYHSSYMKLQGVTKVSPLGVAESESRLPVFRFR